LWFDQIVVGSAANLGGQEQTQWSSRKHQQEERKTAKEIRKKDIFNNESYFNTK
jgi:hypothetical protein